MSAEEKKKAVPYYCGERGAVMACAWCWPRNSWQAFYPALKGLTVSHTICKPCLKTLTQVEMQCAPCE